MHIVSCSRQYEYRPIDTRLYSSVRHHLFFDVSFITLRERVATLGNDDIVGADVAVTLAGIHGRPGTVQCGKSICHNDVVLCSVADLPSCRCPLHHRPGYRKGLVCRPHQTGVGVHAHCEFLRHIVIVLPYPHSGLQQGTRRFRWEIITGATLRHYCLTFQSSPELERFTELFLNGRRAALGWELPRDLPLEVAHAPSRNRERQPETGGEATLLPVDADDSYWDLCVAFVRMFIGLAMIRVVMVLSDRAVDTVFKYYQYY